MPPSPNIATGPNTGSRWMPRMHSTPPVSCLATSTPSMRASGAARPRAFQQRREARPHRGLVAPRPAARRRSRSCAGCPATGSSAPPESRCRVPRPRRPLGARAGALGRAGDAGLRRAGASPRASVGVASGSATGRAPAAAASGAARRPRRSGPSPRSRPPRGSGPRTRRSRPLRSPHLLGRGLQRQHEEAIRVRSRTAFSCSRSLRRDRRARRGVGEEAEHRRIAAFADHRVGEAADQGDVVEELRRACPPGCAATRRAAAPSGAPARPAGISGSGRPRSSAASEIDARRRRR